MSTATVVRRAFKLVLLAGLAATVGCADSLPTSAPSRSLKDSRSAHLSSAVGKPSTIDDEFAEISSNVDGFGGAYLDDDGTLVLNLSGNADSAAALSALAPKLSGWAQSSGADSKLNEGPFNAASRPVRFGRVMYSFGQLLQWKRTLAPMLMSADGVHSIDVDERANVIAIGVTAESDLRFVDDLVGDHGIPDAAVRVSLSKASIPVRQAANLGSRQRPLTGGFEIGPRVCTMTAVAYRGSEQLMLTASHCTATFFALDGGPTWQGNAGDQWGFEVTDPNSYKCGGLFSSKRCRRADIAAYNVSGISVFPGDTLAFYPGLIARTQYPSSGLTQLAGSRDIDQSFPYWYIQGTATSVLVGMTLHKVGRVTGWTYGDVFQTCVDKQSSNSVWIVCSDQANLFVEPGDSGSPVFIINNSVGVTFVGAVWGKQPGAGATFSNLGQIRQDLGNVVLY